MKNKKEYEGADPDSGEDLTYIGSFLEQNSEEEKEDLYAKEEKYQMAIEKAKRLLDKELTETEQQFHLLPENYLPALKEAAAKSSNSALILARRQYSELLKKISAATYYTDEEFLVFCDEVSASLAQILEGNKLGFYDNNLLSFVEDKEASTILSLLAFVQSKENYETSYDFLPRLTLDTLYEAQTTILNKIKLVGADTQNNKTSFYSKDQEGLKKLIARYISVSVEDFSAEDIVRLGYKKVSQIYGAEKTFELFSNILSTKPEILMALSDKDKENLKTQILEREEIPFKNKLNFILRINKDFIHDPLVFIHTLMDFIDSTEIQNSPNKLAAIKKEYSSFEEYVQKNYTSSFNYETAIQAYQLNPVGRNSVERWAFFAESLAYLGQIKLLSLEQKLALTDLRLIKKDMKEEKTASSGHLLNQIFKNFQRALGNEKFNTQQLDTLFESYKDNAEIITQENTWAYVPFFKHINLSASLSDATNRKEIIDYLIKGEYYNVAAYTFLSYKSSFDKEDSFKLANFLWKQLDNPKHYFGPTLAWPNGSSEKEYTKVSETTQALFNEEAKVVSSSFIKLLVDSRINYLFSPERLNQETLPNFLIDIAKPSCFTTWSNILYNAYSVRYLKEKIKEMPEGTVLFDRNSPQNEYSYENNLFVDFLSETIKSAGPQKNISQDKTFVADYVNLIEELSGLFGNKYFNNTLLDKKGLGITSTFKNGEKKTVYAQTIGDFLEEIVPGSYSQETFPLSSVVKSELLVKHTPPAPEKSKTSKFLSLFRKEEEVEPIDINGYATILDKMIIKNGELQVVVKYAKDIQEVAVPDPDSFISRLNQQIGLTQKIVERLPNNEIYSDIKIAAHNASLSVLDLFTYCQKDNKSIDKFRELEILNFTDYLFSCLKNYNAAISVIGNMENKEETTAKLSALNRDTKAQLEIISAESLRKKNTLETEFLQHTAKEVEVHGTYLKNKFKHNQDDNIFDKEVLGNTFIATEEILPTEIPSENKQVLSQNGRRKMKI